jgi:hypothetical protein
MKTCRCDGCKQARKDEAAALTELRLANGKSLLELKKVQREEKKAGLVKRKPGRIEAL